MLQEVALPGEDAGAFMAAATKFANFRCWGTLCCAVFVHPKTRKLYAPAFDAMMAGLRYGSISVNLPCILG